MKKPLNDDFNSARWAQEFWELYGDRLDLVDMDLMQGWFANAIMCGYDHGRRASEKEQSAAVNSVNEGEVK